MLFLLWKCLPTCPLFITNCCCMKTIHSFAYEGALDKLRKRRIWFLYCQTFLTRTGLTISTLNILIKFLAFSVTSISIILNKNILPPYSPVGLLKVVNFYNGILWGFVENALNFLIFPYFMYFCARDFFFFQQ